MKAFITLESLLEYFVFSTETLQHEDDLIAHSKVSKERPQVQRENNIPQFQAAAPFNPHPLFPSSWFQILFSHKIKFSFAAGIPTGWRGSLRRCSIIIFITIIIIIIIIITIIIIIINNIIIIIIIIIY